MKPTPFPDRFGFVRVALVTTGLWMGATCDLAANYRPGDLIPEVKLKDGTVLHDVKLIGIGATSIMARWTGGQGSIALTQLSQDLQATLAPDAAPKPVAPSETTVLGPGKLASGELPTEIQLTNGFVMHRCAVMRWEEEAVLVNYQGGTVLVQFKNIVPVQRAVFAARKDEALAAQAKVAVEQALAVQAANEAAANAERAWKLKSIEHSMSPNARFMPAPPHDKPAIPEVQLLDGRVLHNFVVSATADKYVMARWTGGEGQIMLTQLSHETRDLMEAEIAAARRAIAASTPGQAEVVTGTPLPLPPDLKLPKDIQLTNRFVMRRCVVTHWEQTSILVSYEGGIVPVQLKNIIPGQRAIFEAKKSEALAAQAKMAAEQARAKHAVPSIEDAWQAKTAQWKEEDARLDEAIDQGLSGGYLVKGMTKVQVKQVLGRPDVGDDPGGMNFIYDHPHRDRDGKPYPREVWFNQKEALASWFNQRENDILGGENSPPPWSPVRTPAEQPVATPRPAPAQAATVASHEVPSDPKLPTDIILTNGFVLHRSVVTRWEAGAVLVSYQGGIVLIQLKNIAPEQRVIFEARKIEALAAQAKLSAEQAVANAAVSNAEQARQAKDARWKGEDNQSAEAIQKGLAERYLVRGMTQEQAKQVMGPPQEIQVNGRLFVYYGKGRDRYGVPANRHLFFDELQFLTSWADQNGNEIDRAVQRTDTH